uniref:amidohydrolase family protein n=1 Tax=Sphingomonas bacterium TaxID=1895847 RepID=UPI0015753E29
RRYTITYDALPSAYLAMLAGNGMARGVLVQPSFLGYDNSFLLDTIGRHRAMLKGIAVVPETSTGAELSRLARKGIVGVRLNLIGQPDPDLASERWRDHLRRVASLGWQVEVQCEAARLPRLLPQLMRSGSPVVLDHFARPDAKLGVDDPGFRYLLKTAPSSRLYVKLSGAYRIGDAVADAAAPLLLDALGPDRLVWGSDWPHTQFEKVASPHQARAALDRWVPDVSARKRILNDTPLRLFSF